MTQEQQVYEYIKEKGSITTLDAFKDLGITRLSAYIYNLKEDLRKKDEERIIDEWVYGAKNKWKKYKIVENENVKNKTIRD